MTIAVSKVKKQYSVTGMISEGKEEAMKLIITVLTAIMVKATPALASSGQETMGTSLLVLLFLGFGALIVICQLIPGLVLFCSMLKGLFGSAEKNTMPKTGAKTL
ncbi:MAG: hypothetical protein ABIK91_07070 [Pseudomonadota bacterium]